MAFLTIPDLDTHLYEDQINEISRNDTAITQAAIDSAIIEMKGYLSPQYDVATIFNATGSNRNPLVLTFCKDIAIWHFITVACPDVEFEHRKDRYQRAIQWLRDIHTRRIPVDLPLKPIATGQPTGDTTHSGGYGGFNGSMAWGSNRKRNNRLD